MKLMKFHVTDFRSINDSGPVTVVDRTVLVGRNESGKSTLLRVLHGLKPQGESPAFTLARDFPRDRPRRDFDEGMEVLRTWWSLEPDEKVAVVKAWPRASIATEFEVARTYKAGRQHSIKPLVPLDDLARPTQALLRVARFDDVRQGDGAL